MAATLELRRWPAERAERAFYLGMALLICAAVFTGFARSFYLRWAFAAPPTGAPSERFFYFKGALYSCWFLLLVVQASLISNGRVALHRRLGIVGAVIAALMFLSGLYGSLLAATRPGGFVTVNVPPLQFLAVPVFDMALFAAFAALAIANRSVPQTHKRLILLACIDLLTAAVARWSFIPDDAPFWVLFAITDLFLVPLIAWDLWSRGRLHPATLIGGLALIASQPLRLAIWESPAWLTIARGLTTLVR